MAQPRAPAVAAPQLLQLQLLLLAASSGSANDPLPVHILDAAASTASGAVCLDGSPPGFYFGAATSAATSNNWVIYFKGGAWCVRHDEASDLANCLSRSQTQLGSSTLFAPTFQFSGMLDSDPAINPDFATWNRVILMYCDGASFSGDRDDPVVVDGTPLYFRGHRVLDALLDELLTPAFGLNRAEQVLLAGGSAGGLATFLHTDFVRSKMPPSVRTFKAAPVSGFFLQHDTQQMIDNPRMASSNPQQFSVVEGASFPAQMRRVFEMQHCAGGVSQACIAAQPKGEEWRCMMAAPTLAAATVPTFVINSAADSWQLGNILKLPHGPPDTCSRVGFGGCDETQLSQIQSYMDDFVADLRATAAFQRPGNGFFVESCYEHVGEQTADKYTRYALTAEGETAPRTMQQALGDWWRSSSSAPVKHYLPCELSSTRLPHQCNPSCIPGGQHGGGGGGGGGNASPPPPPPGREQCPTETWSDRAQEMMNTCCPGQNGGGGGGGHRRVQGGGGGNLECTMPSTCDEGDCARVVVAFHNECGEFERQLGFMQQHSYTKFLAKCEEAGSGGGGAAAAAACTSASSCAQLRWGVGSHDEDDEVCAVSPGSGFGNSPTGECLRASYADALQTCSGFGARLCTLDELEAEQTSGTGCAFDNVRIWTRSVGDCASGSEHKSAAGRPSNWGTVGPQCSGDAEVYAVRCCADVDPTVAPRC